MASQLTPRAASGIEVSAASTEAETPPRRRSPALRRLKRIGWSLIPPLTFAAIVAMSAFT